MFYSQVKQTEHLITMENEANMQIHCSSTPLQYLHYIVRLCFYVCDSA